MLPDFLMREPEEPDEETLLFEEAIERYKKEIGDHLITEPSCYSPREWADMLNECVEKHITIWELWGEPYDPECDY